MRIGDRITSTQTPKKPEPSKPSTATIDQTKQNDNWILDITNPLSPLSPFNIINWDS